MTIHQPIYLVTSLEDTDIVNYRELSTSEEDCQIIIGRQGEIIDRDTDDGILFMCWGTDLESLIQRMKDYKVWLLTLEEDNIKIRKQTIQNKEAVFLEN